MNELTLIVLLAIAVVIYVLVMPFVALNRANEARRVSDKLREEVKSLREQLGSSGKKTKKSKPETKTAVKRVAKSQPVAVKTAPVLEETTPKPRGPNFFQRMYANFQENWLVWVAALSLALGGTFFIQYGIEKGFFGPVARVLSALGFGAALLAVAERLRRTSDMGLEGWFNVPSALAAGGIASLYGGVVGAHVLYELTSPLVGFASMVAVSFLAVGAGILYGPVLATIGILGAYITPFLITGKANPMMYLYFLSVFVAALVVERHQRWIWLSTLAAVGAFGWGILLVSSELNPVYFPLYIGAIILLSAKIPAFGMRPVWDDPQMISHKNFKEVAMRYPTLFALAAGVVGTVVMIAPWSVDLSVLQATLMVLFGLIVWSIYWANKAQNLDQLAPVFGLGLIGLSVYMGLQPFSWGTQNITSTNVSSAFSWMGFSTLAAAVAFMVGSVIRPMASIRPLYWVALGAAFPVIAFVGVNFSWQNLNVFTDPQWLLVAVLLVLILVGSAVYFMRQKHPHRVLAADLYSAGALIVSGYMVWDRLPQNYIAHGLAILSLIALLAVIKFGFYWTSLLIWGFVSAAGAFAVYYIVPDLFFEWPMPRYFGQMAGLAALFGGGYILSSRAKISDRALLYETAGLLIGAVAFCGAIFQIATNGNQYEYAIAGIWASVWALMAAVQFKRMQIADTFNWARNLLGCGYGGIALLSLIGAIVLNPIFQRPTASWQDGLASVRGFFPIDTAAIAYLIPALIILGMWRFKFLPSFVKPWMVYTLSGALALLTAIIEIRRFWHGVNIRYVKGVVEGELYTYTVILLIATISSVALALFKKSPYLRTISLGLAGLTAAKVFLWDMAGMQGLPRATAFIILGLTLAGIGWLLQNASFEAKEDEKA